ncbi:zinc finger, PHD-type containing protein [Tanacetum coccineum]
MSDMTACLNDLNYIPLNNEQNEPTQGDIGETSNDLTQAKRNEFEELYASANEELYPGCDYVTRLDFMAKFTYFKVKGKLTDSIFNEMLEFFQNVFPTAKGYKLPPSYYAIKKTFKTIGLGYESDTCCVNDCFVFGRTNKDVHSVGVNTSRWKDSNTPGKKVPKNPKSPGKDIDVYLRPLIDDLKDLWALKGVETIDVATGQKFNMKAMVLWTINDFPARSKIAYVGHIRFLKKPHKWTRSRDFNGETEDRDPPREFKLDQILTQLNRLPTREKGKHPSYGGVKIKRNVLVKLNWTKRSIFYDLKYWSFLTLKHNLDVMHIEKNMLKIILNTLLMNDKSKDTTKARQDLKNLGIQSELWLGPNKNGKCSKPQALYSFTPENGKYLVHQRSETTRWQYLPPFVTTPIIELCSFFKQICSRTLMEDDMVKAQSKDDMLKAQSKVVYILCNLELIYPPDFFDIMIHLVIHLPLEALEGGPIRPRWMFPFERFMKKLKGYVRNKAKPEGSIAEGYVVEEALNFSSHYFRDVTKKFNRPGRNVDPPPQRDSFRPEIDTYLYHSPEIDIYLAKFKSRDERRTTQNNSICSPGEKDGEMYYEDDHDVIHFDNSFDLELSTCLNDLDFATLNIDGQSMDVDATPDINDVDEDGDSIDDEDVIPHDLADSDDEYVITKVDELTQPIHDHPVFIYVKQTSQYIKSISLFQDKDPGVSASGELFALAYGPTSTTISVNSCVVNGVRFVVHSRDERRTTQKKGICSPGEKDEEMYYGQLEEILEFSYMSFKVVLFRVKWFDTSNEGPKIKRFVIRNNITQIWACSDSFKDDQYILATQVKQVFYLKDMARRPPNRKVVQDVNHKKFSSGGVIVVEDDHDVIHFDNSYDLALSTSLNDLDFATLNIDGQSMDVDATPDIIDVDEDDDFIDDEDVISHDLADSDDEVLATDEDDDVVVVYSSEEEY